MFLTPDELRDLTGCVKPASQERRLREMGLTVHRNAANRVMLAREALVRWQLGERGDKRPAKEPQVRLRAA